MKILFGILVLSVAAVIVVVGAMWGLLRRHMRKSDNALRETVAEIQPEHQPVEK